jgi:alpha-tubulin suppressor-like RCC1 family protein
MWGAGDNTRGELGNDSSENKILTLTRLSDKRWKSVWRGYSHSNFAIDESGYMYACGYNDHGSLGIGEDNNVRIWTKCNNKRWKKVASGHMFSLAIGEDDYLYACGWVQGISDVGGTNEFRRVHQFDRVKDIATSYEASYVVDYGGRLFVFGANTGHLLGAGEASSTSDGAVQILKGNNVDRIVCSLSTDNARFAFIKR